MLNADKNIVMVIINQQIPKLKKIIQFVFFETLNDIKQAFAFEKK